MQYKFLLPILIAITAVASFLWVANTPNQPNHTKVLSDSLRKPSISILPINSLGFSDSDVNDELYGIKMQRDQGFMPATEDEVEYVAIHKESKNSLLDMNTALANLSFVPAFLSIESNILHDSKLIGMQPAGILNETKGWSSVAALYEVLEMGDVLLEEKALVPGMEVQVYQESINMVINGHPAIYQVQISSSGKALSSLSWFTDESAFDLYVSGNAYKQPLLKEKMIMLAKSIPTSNGNYQLDK